MADESIDYFWSYRSHYCYLSIGRVIEIAQRYPVSVRFRPVYPMLIRDPDFIRRMRGSGTNRWTYIVRDTERIAERLELPFAWPKPDPVAVDMATLSVNNDQPHIFRLTHLGVEAGRRGLGLEFTAAVARLIFGGTRDWHEGAHLRDAVATVGLDLDELDRCIARDPDGYAGEVRANEATLEAAGHWGVPTLVLDNEPFFGQDRIEDFRWRLEQRGVRPR